jgi:hypothetical protein
MDGGRIARTPLEWLEMAAVEPEIRAAWCKFAVRSLKRQTGALGERLRQEMPSALRAEIRAAPRMGWCALRVFMELCQFLVAAGGMEGAKTFWHDCLYSSIDQPLMRPLVHSGLFVFGRTPAALIKRTPLAWNIVARHCGHMAAHESDGRIALEVTDMAPGLRRLAFLPVLEGGFLAQIHYVRCEGSVTSDSNMLGLGRASCDIRWQAPAQA